MEITIEKYKTWVKKYGQDEAKAMADGCKIVDADGKEVLVEVETKDNSELIMKAVKEAVSSEVKAATAGLHVEVMPKKVRPLHETVKGIVDGSLKAAIMKQTGGNDEDTVADGGALIVPTLDSMIYGATFEQGIMNMVRKVPVSGETLYTTWRQYPATTAKTQSAQLAQKDESKLQFSRGTVTLESHYWLVPVSNQLLEDAPQMANMVIEESVSQINRTLEDGIINGTPTGFTGVIGDAATLTLPRNTAGAIDRDDIERMFARLWPSGGLNKATTAWVSSPTALPSLLAIRDLNGIMIDGAPALTLYGYPIVVSPFCQAIGTVGDILLADWSKYVVGTKSQMIRSDISTHLWFDYNTTAFRTEARLAGVPAQRTLIAENGVNYSYFIELGDVGSSEN